MHVRLFPADEGACSYFRHRLPAGIAEREGWQVTLHEENFCIAQDPHGRMVPVTRELVSDGVEYAPILADVVVLQRPAKSTLIALIEAFRAMGTAVVVDVDDDFSAIPPNHPAHRHFNGGSPTENSRHLAQACAMADLVTVTTDPLAQRYGSHGRVAVLPNCVPEALLQMPRCSDGQTLGWGGVVSHHPDDLEVVGAGVSEALQHSRWHFRVVGPGQDVARRLCLERVEATGFIETVPGYHVALGSLDVGIAPLCDSAFTRAKSGLKALEMAARGVPCVLSPRPEYEALTAEGIGVLAQDRSRSWRRELCQLMADESLRWEMAERGREVVAEGHTIEAEGWRWLEAWEHAYVSSGQRAAVLS